MTIYNTKLFMLDLSKFAERLQELMDTAEINAHTLSKKVVCGHSSLHRYLNGENPSLKNLIKLADYFRCSTDFLLGLTNDYVQETYLPIPPFAERLLFLLRYFKKSAYYLYTQTEIAESVVDGWKKGTHTPTVDSVVRIAKLFDCSVDFVIGRTNSY